MRRWAPLVVLLGLLGCQPDKADRERALQQDAVLTSGAAIDCTGDLSEASRLICADADLRAMDRQITELWSRVEAVTGRPNTLRRRHADWLADREAGEREWETGDRRARTAEELREYQQAYFDGLTEELRLAESLPATSPIASLSGGCIGTALNGCTTPSNGVVTGADGQRLAWQIQRGSTEFAGVSEGLVLFAIDGDLLRPVGWSFEAAQFDAPILFSRPEGLFVAAKGFTAGTGAGNADILLRLDGQRWTEIEIESWKVALDEALPDDLGVWKGVDYAWPDMTAMSSLWRDSDANCCPTGGRVLIDLEVEGTTLRLAGFDLERTSN